VDDAFIKGAGYNRWAAMNRLIVLYPQVAKSAANSRGCWDWWGYTGSEFLTREAPQIKAVRAMLERLAE
jgi:poly(3-hydroxybutyrate) depolymerase